MVDIAILASQFVSLSYSDLQTRETGCETLLLVMYGFGFVFCMCKVLHVRVKNKQCICFRAPTHMWVREGRQDEKESESACRGESNCVCVYICRGLRRAAACNHCNTGNSHGYYVRNSVSTGGGLVNLQLCDCVKSPLNQRNFRLHLILP